MKTYYVYLLASRSKALYVGVTGTLYDRVWQHKLKLVEGHTQRYNIDRLVYFEKYLHPEEAIRREKQLKGWRRVKKVSLIEQRNPDWDDLAAEWIQPDAVAE